ncbi:MAG TPA: glycosyltransferase family 4 protein, partial [Vicinamibacteria bacterium]|nr:glycosyltransferase family 4 protein [Vicinamibacteria bacterium]
GHEVHLAAGEEDHLSEAVPAEVHHLRGLAARRAEPVALEPLLRRLDPDVLHVHTVMNPVALQLCADRGAVFTVQDHRCFCPGRGKWTASGEVCQATFSPADCAPCFDDDGYGEEMSALTRARLDAVAGSTVVVLSEYMRGELVRAGLSPARVRVVPPFADFDPPGPPADDGPPCVLFVGRLVAAKGPLDAVAAWRRSGLPLPLVVAGTGPLRPAVEASGADVRGWVPHRELPALLRRARALVMTPRWQEPFGIVGLEALAFGVPVVSWDSGGIREWHPGPLPAWGDVEALAAALRDAVKAPAPAPGTAGFGREEAMRRLEDVYEGARRVA